jgi:hypothetical protein
MVLIKLNNQDIEIKYTVNEICALEEKTGKGIMALLDQDNMGFNIIRLLLWAGLRHKNPALTPELTGLWIQEGLTKKELTFAIITEKCMKALEESGILGDKEEKENKNEVGKINPV